MPKVTITKAEVFKHENVFMCYGEHVREVIEVSASSKLECPHCSGQMELIGWTETPVEMDCE